VFQECSLNQTALPASLAPHSVRFNAGGARTFPLVMSSRTAIAVSKQALLGLADIVALIIFTHGLVLFRTLRRPAV